MDADSGTDSSTESESLLESQPRSKKRSIKRKRKKETRSPLVPHAKRTVTPAETPVKSSGDQHVGTAPKSGRKKSLRRPEGQPTIRGFFLDQKPVRKLSSEDGVEHCYKNSKRGNETPSKYETVSMGDSEMFLCHPEINVNETSEAVDSPTSKGDSDDFFSGKATSVPSDKGDSDIEILEVVKGIDDTNKADKEVNADIKADDHRQDDEVDAGSNKDKNEQDDEVDAGSKGKALKRTCERCGGISDKKIKTEPESYDADSTTLIGAKTETATEAAAMSDVSGAAYASDASDCDVSTSSPPGIYTVLTFSVRLHFSSCPSLMCIKIITITARNNVFTHVCDSVREGGCLCPSMHQWSHDQGGLCSEGGSLSGRPPIR